MADPLIKFVESVAVQTAVYWSNPQPDGYGGKTYDSPVEISCRWDDKRQVVKDDVGNEVVSESEVLVTQDIDNNGYLYLGSLDDLDSDQLDNPESVQDAYMIIQVNKHPLFQSASEFVRVVYL